MTLKRLRQVKFKGKAPLFSMSKPNLNPPFGAYGALKIMKNEIESRKLWPPKVEGVKIRML